MNVDGLIEQWKRYAHANRVRADIDRARGDLFGAELCLARGAVRLAAAHMLADSSGDPMAAANNMHQKAKQLHQHHWPFARFDETAVKYTQARTWQDCARAIDPGLPEVQPKLRA